jgi:hypothetical protein
MKKWRTRHMGRLTDKEICDLTDHVADWLQAHGVAGSILGEYSIYTAVEEECEKAQLAYKERIRFGWEQEEEKR